jgi:hypothetical protein
VGEPSIDTGPTVLERTLSGPCLPASSRQSVQRDGSHGTIGTECYSPGYRVFLDSFACSAAKKSRCGATRADGCSSRSSARARCAANERLGTTHRKRNMCVQEPMRRNLGRRIERDRDRAEALVSTLPAAWRRRPSSRRSTGPAQARGPGAAGPGWSTGSCQRRPSRHRHTGAVSGAVGWFTLGIPGIAPELSRP